MRLLTLHMQNFRTHEDTIINFPSLGSPVLIKGVNRDRPGVSPSNGAGKSSIFEAIDYALFHKTRDYLRYGTAKGKVCLEFEHKGNTYKIDKDFTAADYTIKVYKDGGILSEQKTEVDRIVRDVIGISRGMFEQTIYQSQGFNSFFGLLSPKLKSQYVMELLEIDKWEKYYEVTRGLLTSLNESVNKLKMQCEVVDMIIATNKATLATKNEADLKLKHTLKTGALQERKIALTNYQQIGLLQAQRVPLEARRRVVSGTLGAVKADLAASLLKLDKYQKIEQDLIAKNIIPIDENYRTMTRSNSLAQEKLLAAKEQEIKSKSAEIEKFDKMKTAILAQSICPFCRRSMNEGNYSQQLEQHMLGERAALRSDYDALQVSFGNLIATRDSLAQQLEAVNAQAVVHTEHVKSLTATKVQVDILTAQVLNLTQQKDAYRQELDSLDPQLATIDQVLLATDLSQIRTLELDVTALEVELRTIEAELTSITDLKEQISLHTAGNTANHWQYAKYLGQVEKLRHVANIFSINGIQKWLFVSALNEISALANSLIRPIGFSIIFQLEKSKKSGEGFKPVFDILVTKTPDNRVLNLEDLSGAEKALVHFSIRLAFSTIIATNHDFRFMIIDEGFGDLDASNREYLANTIKHLSKQYQIFLVTHFPDFESEFPNIMLIERENGVSRIISPQN